MGMDNIQTGEDLNGEGTVSDTDGTFDGQSGKNVKKPSSASAILKVALRAAFWFLFALALFLACFTAFFPYASMKIYNFLGLKQRAFNSAERVIRSKYSPAVSYDSKFADALYLAVPLSAGFLDEAINSGRSLGSKDALNAAEKAAKYAAMHEALAYGAGTKSDMAVRDGMIDDAVRELPPVFHPDSYRYRDSVRIGYLRARYVTDVTSNDYESFFSEFENLNGLYSDLNFIEGDLDRNIDNYARWFLELNSVIELELDILGYDYTDMNDGISDIQYILGRGIKADGRFLYLYSKGAFYNQGSSSDIRYEAGKSRLLETIEKRLGSIKSFIDGFDVSGDTVSDERENLLKRAYLARCVSLLTRNIHTVTEIIYANNDPGSDDIVEDWRAEYNVYYLTNDDDYENDNIPSSPERWYDQYLRSYLDSFSGGN
jgi:hypothetical protein